MIRGGLAVCAVAALVVGCSPSQASSAHSSYGIRIDTNTPAGMRAQQTMDMLNSDWPIGTNGVSTMAVDDQVMPIAQAMDRMWWDRPFSVTGSKVGEDVATLDVVTSYGAHQTIEIHTDDDGLVTTFVPTRVTPEINQWSDVDHTLGQSGARYSYQVSRIEDGRCVHVAGTNVTESLPLASIFKLYVLYAVSDAVKAGTLSWGEQLTVTAAAKAVGTSGLDDLEPGSTVSVRTAAQEMIASSDNMATDLLISRVGTHAVEQALAETGHHDPASMTPFPTMHELFSVGWGTPDLREQWKQADRSGRAELLKQTNSRPYEPDPERVTSPASAYGAEWYGSADDICRVHVALQEGAVGAAAAVHDILSKVPGIDLDPTEFPYIGAKAGNLPGDLTFSWYVVDGARQPYVVSFQLNWPRYQGPNAAAWLYSVAKEAFGLIHKQA